MVFFRGNDTLKAGPLGFTGAQRRQEVPPHFTFQSSGGCDFLPHFQSDNIRGWRRGSNGSREKKGTKRWKGCIGNRPITCLR